MLLALDAGNSNITIGAFEGRELVCQWRLRTVHEQTADEWGILLRNLFSPAGLDIAKVDGIIICERGAAHRFHARLHDPALLPHRSHVRRRRSTDIGLDDPLRQSQRSGRGPPGERRRRLLQIRRSVRGGGHGHHHQLRRDLAATANTWAAPSRSASASRSRRCSPRRRACRWWISVPPKDVVGTNTVASMQSGLYYGAVGMIDGILERIIAKARAGDEGRRHRRAGAHDRRAARAT